MSSEIELFGEFADAPPDLPQAVEVGEDEQIFRHRELFRQLDVGRGEIHARQGAVALARHVHAEHAHAARSGEQHAEQDRERGGLAGAVAAQQRAGGAARDLEAQAVHGLHAAVALHQVFHRDRVAQALPLQLRALAISLKKRADEC